MIGTDLEGYLQSDLQDGSLVGVVRLERKGLPPLRRAFDGSYTKGGREVWIEAKSGNFWQNPEATARFLEKTSQQLTIAKANGVDFEVHSNAESGGEKVGHGSGGMNLLRAA